MPELGKVRSKKSRVNCRQRDEQNRAILHGAPPGVRAIVNRVVNSIYIVRHVTPPTGMFYEQHITDPEDSAAMRSAIPEFSREIGRRIKRAFRTKRNACAAHLIKMCEFGGDPETAVESVRKRAHQSLEEEKAKALKKSKGHKGGSAITFYAKLRPDPEVGSGDPAVAAALLPYSRDDMGERGIGATDASTTTASPMSATTTTTTQVSGRSPDPDMCGAAGSGFADPSSGRDAWSALTHEVIVMLSNDFLFTLS